MKKIVVFIIVSLLTIFSIAFANVEVPNDIRIGLFYSSTAKNSVTLSSPGGLEVGVVSNGKFNLSFKTQANEQVTVTKSSNKAVLVSPYGVELGTSTEFPYFKSLEKDGVSLVVVDGKKYRGNIEIRRLSDSDMTVINHLSMQEYLYGVVPREIGGASPLEAVKAQAIIARTYAAKNIGRRSGLGFDLYPTATDQAYGGYEWEHQNSNKAVDLTYGLVATYNNQLIGGNYFSTSGGYTESSENVWGGSVDYLKAVPDTYEPVVEGNTSWEVTMTKEQVKASLSKNGINVGDIIDLVPIEFTEAGRVLKLKIIGTAGEKIIERDKVRTALGLKSQWYTINSDAPVVKSAGAVITPSYSEKEDVIIPDSKPIIEDEVKPEPVVEEQTVSNENSVKVLTRKETDFGEVIVLVDENGNTIIKNGEKEQNIIIDGVTSTNTAETTKEDKVEQQKVDPKKTLLNSILSYIRTCIISNDSRKTNSYTPKYMANETKTVFVFRGRGWGHAVGMSQNGAKGMANNGFSAEEIIKWYYSGVEIED